MKEAKHSSKADEVAAAKGAGMPKKPGMSGPGAGGKGPVEEVVMVGGKAKKKKKKRKRGKPGMMKGGKTTCY